VFENENNVILFGCRKEEKRIKLVIIVDNCLFNKTENNSRFEILIEIVHLLEILHSYIFNACFLLIKKKLFKAFLWTYCFICVF